VSCSYHLNTTFLTTDSESLKDYFSQFGEVLECTVMRDGASGRSRGFGFLTFKDARTVNIVMVKEHYLDGKIVRPDLHTHVNSLCHYTSKLPLLIQNSCSPTNLKIDPKRAIPRDEQEKTSKIFVGGVSQEATEQDFKEYFMQFGRVVDATLMMDKDTGRPRGFGFVTFDNEAAVDACLAQPLEILGKPIEVKKAQPRGNMREEEETRGGRGGRFRKGGGSDENQGNAPNMQQQSGNQMAPGGMTPQLMAQYWQRMQQYFAMMQQQVAMGGGRGIGGMPGGMNPAMMAQMAQMQQMQQMQQQMQSGAGAGARSQSPQSPGAAMAAMQGMNPAMMQQMQQMQQMQMQQQGMSGGNGGAYAAGGGSNPGGRIGTPGYNAYEQQMFEQQKYEQQQMRRAQREQSQYAQGGGYGIGGGPTSWEGMYDDVPQPNVGGIGNGAGRGGFQGGKGGGSNRGSAPPQTGPQSAPPANAPTGPKNAGKPGANYRGGGRGGQRGFHPYARG
jgi:RNA-binding protein Musashi